MDFKINQFEQTALKGLPHLPRLVYLELRPHMDYSTGIVGIKRGVSYQSLREELYVEPHQGYASGSPSKDQIRRSIKTLERAGLISIHSESKKLIVKCELATWDNCAQNKVATKAPHQVATKSPFKNSDKTSTFEFETVKATTDENAKAATPPVSDNYFIFLRESFEKFWQLYPVKQSKPKAWDVFQNLSPTEQLISQMIDALEKQITYRVDAAAQNHWMPNWKHVI